MSIKFGVPSPIRIHHPTLFFAGIIISLSAILFSTVIVDKIGTAMFTRGFAKPFYIKGHRIHHSCIYLIAPTGYAAFLGLYLLGYIQILWGSLYDNLAYIIIILAITMSVDFLGDKFWPKIRRNVILHHEWIYTLVPAYILAYMVVVVI
ncbi:MAG: hypothetical protein ACYCPW_06660 [Nitrososphaerales archaeon]